MMVSNILECENISMAKSSLHFVVKHIHLQLITLILPCILQPLLFGCVFVSLWHMGSARAAYKLSSVDYGMH